MHSSIIDEICTVRKEKNINIISTNKNRYLVVVDGDNTQTAYYFSAPVHRNDNKELVELNFSSNEGEYLHIGTNSSVCVNEAAAYLKGKNGSISIIIEDVKGYELESGNLVSEKAIIYPTLNGLAMSIKCPGGKTARLKMCTSNNFRRTRSNNKCLAFMKDNFTPYAVISAIAAKVNSEDIYVPALLSYQKTGENDCVLDISPSSYSDSEIMLEINMYEHKLFQDTTVESGSPKENNAFGSTAFIGSSDTFGSQWLYSKIVYSRITEVKDKHINSAKLYIPQLGKSGSIAAFALDCRFCSFGSNWKNKIAFGRALDSCEKSSNYQTVDLTNLIVREDTHTLKSTDGILLKAPSNANGSTAIFTGDSSFMPQMLEINYNV